jgi:integrase/recombinase XerD
MVELAQYRPEGGLSPFPTPLLLPIGGKQRAMTRSAVYLIVKVVFSRTAARIRERGAVFERLSVLATPS